MEGPHIRGCSRDAFAISFVSASQSFRRPSSAIAAMYESGLTDVGFVLFSAMTDTGERVSAAASLGECPTHERKRPSRMPRIRAGGKIIGNLLVLGSIHAWIHQQRRCMMTETSRETGVPMGTKQQT